MELRPHSIVTIVSGSITKIDSGEFKTDGGEEVAYQKIEVAYLGGLCTVKPTRDQYIELQKRLKVGDLVQAAGKGGVKDKMPFITDLVSVKKNGVELLVDQSPLQAAANDQQATLAAYPGPSTAAPPTRRAA